ncbi:hypothetical protein D9M68_798220 [compost metagenome]
MNKQAHQQQILDLAALTQENADCPQFAGSHGLALPGRSTEGSIGWTRARAPREPVAVDGFLRRIQVAMRDRIVHRQGQGRKILPKRRGLVFLMLPSEMLDCLQQRDRATLPGRRPPHQHRRPLTIERNRALLLANHQAQSIHPHHSIRFSRYSTEIASGPDPGSGAGKEQTGKN